MLLCCWFYKTVLPAGQAFFLTFAAQMSEQAEKFLSDAEVIVFDNEHRRKLAFNILQYDKKVEHGKHQYSKMELAKQRAANCSTRPRQPVLLAKPVATQPGCTALTVTPEPSSRRASS